MCIINGDCAVLAYGDCAAVSTSVLASFTIVYNRVVGENSRPVVTTINAKAGSIIHQDSATPDTVFVKTIGYGCLPETIDLGTRSDGQRASPCHIDRSAVLATLLSIEPDVLHGQVSAVSNSKQCARVGILGGCLTIGAGDMCSGRICGTGGAEDIPVFRIFCFSCGKGDVALAVVVDNRCFLVVGEREREVLQYLQLQSFYIGRVPLSIDEGAFLRSFKALFQCRIDCRETPGIFLRILIVPDLMSLDLNIEQVVICVRQLADNLLVGNDIIIS